jgi:hypothetical protein
VVFVTCARHPSEIIFRERLEHMASRVPGIDLKFVVGGTDLYPPWTGYQGTLNQLMMVPDYLEREVVCCGPEPFMQAMREAVAAEVAFTLSGVQQTCAETGTILATTRMAGRNIPRAAPAASAAPASQQSPGPGAHCAQRRHHQGGYRSGLCAGLLLASDRPGGAGGLGGHFPPSATRPARRQRRAQIERGTKAAR